MNNKNVGIITLDKVDVSEKVNLMTAEKSMHQELTLVKF